MTTVSILNEQIPAGLSVDQRLIFDIEVAMPRAQSVDELTRSWANDVEYFDFGPGEHRSKAAAMAELSRQFGTIREIATTILDLTITVSGDLAATFSLQNYRSLNDGAIRDGGTALDFVFRKTNIYMRRERAWEVRHQHVSVPVDVATGQIILRPPAS